MKKQRNTKEFERLKKEIVNILRKYHIKKAGIFGSYARGEERKKSDVDIVIQPSKTMGFQFAGIEIELQQVTGKKIDLVTYKGLNVHLKKDILREEKRLI